MFASVLLPAGILLATIALGTLAALSLAESRPSAPEPRAVGSPARLVCPMTGDLARVGIGIDLATRSVGVLWCERFEEGAITCDRACFPSAPLEAVA